MTLLCILPLQNISVQNTFMVKTHIIITYSIDNHHENENRINATQQYNLTQSFILSSFLFITISHQYSMHRSVLISTITQLVKHRLRLGPTRCIT